MNAAKIHDLIFAPFIALYAIWQQLLDVIFSPTPPPPNANLSRRKIAVIGAGLTGVSAASHCVGHGFDVVLFEAGDRDSIGGIWTVIIVQPQVLRFEANYMFQKVNNTSGLQINSLMYRFQPSVKWSGGYPKRNEIVDQVKKLWQRYGLEEKTKFKTRVEKIYKDSHGRWVINDPSNGRFDGVIAAVGSCGEPKMSHLPDQDKFRGEIYHSSQLDGKSAQGKKVIIVGGGASAVEALEFVDREQAEVTYVLARV